MYWVSSYIGVGLYLSVYLEGIPTIDDVESSGNGSLVYLFVPNRGRVEIGCYQYGLGSDLTHLSKFVFGGEWLMLSPFL